MKRISQIVQSPTAPTTSDVLWLDTSNKENIQLKVSINGSWCSIDMSDADLEGFVKEDQIKQRIDSSNDSLLSQKALEGYYSKNYDEVKDVTFGKGETYYCAELGSHAGTLILDRIKGNSLHWLDLCTAVTVESDEDYVNGVKVTNLGNRTIQVDVQEEHSSRDISLGMISFVTHTYLLRGTPENGSSDTYSLKLASTINDYGSGTIFTIDSDGTSMSLKISIKAGCPSGTYTFHYSVLDLTELFGEGNEPSTIEGFDAVYSDKYLDSTIINNNTTTLTIKNEQGTTEGMWFIDISNITGKLNGVGEDTTIFSEGAVGFTVNYDYLEVDGDGVSRNAFKKSACIDGGTLNWKLQNSNGNRYFYADLPNCQYNAREIMCVKYVSGKATSISGLKLFHINQLNNRVYIKDDYVTAKDFKESMSGVNIYYPLNVAQKYELSYPSSSLRINITPNCSIMQAPANSPTLQTAPMKMSYRVAREVVKEINALPEEYIPAEQIDDFLTALSTAYGGTWSRTYNETTGKHEFTYTA